MQRVLVTAALPYANSDLHLGHAFSTYIPADVYSRFCRLKGLDVVFVCGSDEHGTPVSVAARDAGRTPLEHVNYFRERQLRDLKDLEVSFDNYHRTHSEENRKLTEEFLIKLRKNGYIYKKRVKLFYCETDKMYLPDRMIKGRCPYCGAREQYSDSCEVCGRTIEPGKILEPYCVLCGSPPSEREEEHFIFKLSAFSERLQSWLTSKRREDFPRDVVNYVVQWIRDGLQDWDITREDYWGFRLPYDDAKENQYVYVWFDAPLGYIASTINWSERTGRNWKDYWMGDCLIVHFIGKDIVYHHLLFWPAMLMGVGDYTLPGKYVVNGYLTLEGRKMSKSRRWLIPLRHVLDRFPADYIRFYLSSKASNSVSDNDFSWKEFMGKINGDLVDNVGNFVHRVLTFISRWFEGEVPKPRELDERDKEFLSEVRRMVEEVEAEYEKCDFSKVIRRILEAFKAANSYFTVKAPWEAVKKGGDAATPLYICANFLYSAAICLYPIIPASAEKIFEMMNVKPGNWDTAKELSVKAGHKINKPKPLFRKMTEREVEEEIKALEEGRIAIE
ncbi:MAG: methionine--tRNA ligase [Candidatus Freyarchaeota archaeon]